MHTRNSLTKALQKMGIEPATSKLDTETMHWQAREREFLMDMCRDREIEVEVIGEKRDNYTIHGYKAARQAADELNAELEILNAEKQEAEAQLASMNLENENYLGEIEENKQHLVEINAEITEKEKRCNAYEQKIDRIITSGKPVKKELEIIRQKTKEIPALLSGEKFIKIYEKDFNRVMDMAKASGTLEKLNEEYDKDMDQMQAKIEKLTNQVHALKEKLTKTEMFMKMKGMLEEFKEYLKPKTLTSRLLEKQKLTDEREEMRQNDRIKKDRGIAI